MALFGKRKQEKCSCSDSRMEGTAKAEIGGNADVIILGSGCKKCNELEANTKAAVSQLGMDATVGHITDFAKIADYGVMSMPALVLGEKVISSGKVLKTDEIIKLLQEHGMQQ